jgi:hypothetical protein
LVIESRRFARFVHIADAHYRAARDWFHLPAGRPVRIALLPLNAGETAAAPNGEVRAINSISPSSTADHQQLWTLRRQDAHQHSPLHRWLSSDTYASGIGSALARNAIRAVAHEVREPLLNHFRFIAKWVLHPVAMGRFPP